MRAEEIISLLSDPASPDPQVLMHLENLVKEYPFFQTAHLLYTLSLHACKDTRFQPALKRTACYAGDRKKLFWKIEGGFFSSFPIERLEETDEPEADSPFDLIDFFLTEKNAQFQQQVSTSSGLTGNDEVSSDYMSFLLSEESRKQEVEIIPLQHQETIDKFLEEDKRAPIRFEWKDTEPGKESLPPDWEAVETESFFSETLAKIYLKQKKYERALEIIRKLNLVYPEKNIYFADQIRFLEKLITNTKKTE